MQHLAIWGTGTDNVDLAAAQAAGIVVTNTPNTATEAVAEQGLALLLAVARKVPGLDAQVKSGAWVCGMLTQVCGKTLECSTISPYSWHDARSAHEWPEPVRRERRGVFTGTGTESGSVGL